MEKISPKEFVEILQNKYKNTDHYFGKFYLGSTISISDVTIEEEVVLDVNFEYNSKIELRNINAKFIRIKRGQFNGILTINGGTYSEGITFDLDYADQINLLNVSTPGDILFIGGNYGQVVFDSCQVKNIKFYGGKYEHISFNRPKHDNLEIINYIEKLEFIDTLIINLINEVCTIINTTINNLVINGHVNKPVEIKNIKLHSLSIDRIHPKNKFTLQNISILPYEKILNPLTIGEFYQNNKVSDKRKKAIQNYTWKKIHLESPIDRLHLALTDELYLKRKEVILVDKSESTPSILSLKKFNASNSEFVNVPIKNFDKIKIVDSDLSNLKLFNSSFPIDKISGPNNSLYESFNQLYLNAKKDHNKKDQDIYFRASQNTLLMLLWQEYKNAPFSKDSFTKIGSMISLITPRIYSNFGSNWIQAILVTVSVAIFFFSLMLLSTNYDISLTQEGFDNLKKFSTHFLNFINPTHKSNFLDGSYKYSNQFSFMLFDFIGRIFVGIGIYETIKSFRKFSKK